jgi:hypothetical protein
MAKFYSIWQIPGIFRKQITNKSENPILMLSLDLVDLEKGMEVLCKSLMFCELIFFWKFLSSFDPFDMEIQIFDVSVLNIHFSKP